MVLVEQELLKIFLRPKTIVGIRISRVSHPDLPYLSKIKTLLIL